MRRILSGTMMAYGLAAAALAAPIPIDRVVAYVNEYAITLGDVETIIAPQARFLRSRSDAEAEANLETLRRRALEHLIETRLILDAYEAQEGRIPDWAVDQHMDEIVRMEFKGDRNALVRMLAQHRMTLEQWRDDLRQSMIVSAMRSTAVGRNIAVSPGDKKAFYEERRDLFRTDMHVRLRMIVLRPQEASLAESIRNQLLEGADFGTLARQYSQGPRRGEGGEWGWVNVEDLRPELAERARQTPVGVVENPVVTEDEIYLVQVTERKAGEPVPFETAQKEIERLLRAEQAEHQYLEWIERLRKRAHVWVRDDG